MDITNNVTPFSVRYVVGNELPPTVVVGQLCVFKGMCYVGTDDEKWTLLSPIKLVTNIASVLAPLSSCLYIDIQAGTINRWNGAAWQMLGKPTTVATGDHVNFVTADGDGGLVRSSYELLPAVTFEATPMVWVSNDAYIPTSAAIDARVTTLLTAGTVASASTLTTPRNFSIAGKATAATVAFDGSQPVTLNVTNIDATGLTGEIPEDVTVQTQVAGDNSQRPASTAYVDSGLSQKANASDVYTKAQIDTKIGSVMRYKGAVEHVYAVPASGESPAESGLDDPYAGTPQSGTYIPVAGDVWDVRDVGTNYAWNADESRWDELSSTFDASDFVTLSSTQTITGNKKFTKVIDGTVTTAQKLSAIRYLSITDAEAITSSSASAFNGAASVAIQLNAVNSGLLVGDASINVTGNAATASALQTPHTFTISAPGIQATPQSFQGVSDVTIPLVFVTQPNGDNSTKPATTEYVDNAIAALRLELQQLIGQ